MVLSVTLSIVFPPTDPTVGRVDRRAVAPRESLAVLALGPPSVPGQPAILLIPGPVGSMHSMRHLAAHMASRGYAVRIVDPLGMGASSRPDSADYSLGQQAVRLLQVLRSDTPGAPVVIAAIGTSATIAMHMAAIAPEQVGGVVSIAGGPVDQQGTKMLKLALAVAPLLDNRLGRGLARRRFIASMKAQSANTAWMTDSVVQAYVNPLERDLRGVFRSLRAMAGASERISIATRLPLVAAPVRLLLGDTPTPSSPTLVQIDMLRRSVRLFAVDTIRHAGTMLHEEQPEAIVDIMEQLVRAAKVRRTQAVPAQLELELE
ncbi:alpha/beta fold hydrolase [Gemmatimonas phototrophica]|nr:alpha/beta hydrolase [Gemmatimonas phototrophica]